MRYFVWGLVVLLVILHQDNWLWNNDTLIFGFFPITLLYHVCISIGASITWFLAIKFAWPDDLEGETLKVVKQKQKKGGTH